MLCTNLFVQTGLVNGAIGEIKAIVYNDGEMPPQLPLIVVVQFFNYIGLAWDDTNPKNIPITSITRGCRNSSAYVIGFNNTQITGFVTCKRNN